MWEISQKKIINSPLNYTGGKFRLLHQLLPHFPNDSDVFIDLFCGGCTVGINTNYKKVVFNDYDRNLSLLYNTFKNLDTDVVFDLIEQIILKYDLSDTDKYNYEYYKCNSSKGLSEYNKNRFLKLREDFNHNTNLDYYYYIMLYVLIVYAFNNQIRFNSKGEFNLPIGKRDFNKKMKIKLYNFIEELHRNNYIFSSKDFRDIDVLSDYGKNSFVYADPPYLITCASYNEQGKWNENMEQHLLDYLDNLHNSNIKFALSNVLRSKGKENKILLEWTQKNKEKYKIHNLKYSYSNSNYQTKDKESFSEEVLITNY